MMSDGADTDTAGEVASANAFLAAICVRPPKGWCAAAGGNRHTPASGDVVDAWLRVCYQLTPRVERLSPTLALLDLGRCTPTEALHTIQSLLARLVPHSSLGGSPVRAGLAPSGTLAQLALRQTSAARPLRLVTAAEAVAFLRPLPVTLLPALFPRGTITEESVRRLHQYGLHTLGQLARLGLAALRRQFGMREGSALATLAAGQDVRPLYPTPPPATLTLRLRLPDGALPPTEIPALLPLLAAQAATLLQQGGTRTQRLRLTVLWESGAIQTNTMALAQPIYEVARLTRVLRTLLEEPLDPTPDQRATGEAKPRAPLAGAIAGLRLTLEALSPQRPVQGVFWPARAQRLATLAAVAETITVRYGRALVVRPRLAVPAATFHEDRYHFLAAETTADTRGAVVTDREPDRDMGLPTHHSSIADPARGPRVPQPHWW